MNARVIPKLVYLFPYSPTEWDGKRFGFDFMLQKKIAFEVWDMSALVSTRSDNDQEFWPKNYPVKISSFAEFSEKVQCYAQQSIFIDNINNINGFKWQSRKIFRLFKKYNVNYFIVQLGSLPLIGYSQGRAWKNKFRKILNFKKLYIYLQWQLSNAIVHAQQKLFNLYQLPKKIFIGQSEMLTKYLNKYNLNSANVELIHSFDHDRFLEYQNTSPAALFPYDKICVFIDQALGMHSDFGKTISFRPVTPDKYQKSLNLFFDKVEKETGLKVIIAANPRIKYEQNIFGNRPILYAKTLELIAESKLVLMHTSTAVSFAVLFNKPIVILQTHELAKAYGIANLLANMAEVLHAPIINIDEEKVHVKIYPIKQKYYEIYKYKYVLTKDVPRKTTWEFVVDHLN